jgi:hypothetical protein
VKTFPIRVIAIDIGTRTGVAWTDEFRATPSNSTYWDLSASKEEPRAMRWIRFRALLRELVDGSPSKNNMDLISAFIFYEEIKFASSYNAAHSYHSIFAQIEEVCLRTGSMSYPVSVYEIKRFATGNNKANKSQMVAAANKRYGCNLEDDNQVDALFALEVGLEEMENEPERFWI